MTSSVKFTEAKLEEAIISLLAVWETLRCHTTKRLIALCR